MRTEGFWWHQARAWHTLWVWLWYDLLWWVPPVRWWRLRRFKRALKKHYGPGSPAYEAEQKLWEGSPLFGLCRKTDGDAPGVEAWLPTVKSDDG